MEDVEEVVCVRHPKLVVDEIDNFVMKNFYKSRSDYIRSAVRSQVARDVLILGRRRVKK